MASTAASVNQLRVEISKRSREAAKLFQRSDATIAAGDVDKGIEANMKARATEDAVSVLRGKLAQLLPGLVNERLLAASPAIDERARKSRAALAEEATRAAEDFRSFFSAWNGLQDTELGKAVATQLLGDFGAAVLSAATDKIYEIAISRRKVAKGQEIDLAAGREREQLREKIQRETAALGNVDVVAESQEGVA